MKKNMSGMTTTTAIIIIFVSLIGLVSLVEIYVGRVRATHEVATVVRLADGTTEDEVYVGPSKLTKHISTSAIIVTHAEYTLKTAKVTDTKSVEFVDCTLEGIYKPIKCAATNGTTYWVTLTEID